MKMKTTLAAAVIALLPGLAIAQGCAGGHSDTASMSCAEGMMLDVETNTCVTATG